MGQSGKGKASHIEESGVLGESKTDTYWGPLRLQAQLVMVDLEN